MGVTWTPGWTFLHDSERNVFTNYTISVGCSNAPPIYELRPLLGEIATRASDEELRSFVAVMQTGTDDERAAAVKSIADRTLDAMQYDVATTQSSSLR